MPAITDPQQVGKREQLSDVIYLFAVTQTPLQSTMRKGGELDKQLLFQYQVKKLGDRKSGGVPDGKDIEAFDGATPRALIYQRGEVFRRAPMVGFIAAGNTIAGIGDEYRQSKIDQMIELKKDIEVELFSDQDSRPDDGVNGSKFRGLGRFVNAGENAFTELPIPTGFRTPSAQVYTGVLGDGLSTGLTEAAAQLMLQNRWDASGDSGDLSGFVSATIKTRFGLFSRYTPNIAAATPIIRMDNGQQVDGKTLFGPSIDVYRSDWGTFRIMAVNTEFLPDQYRGYFLDMTQMTLRSRETAKEIPLQDQGGGPRELIRSIIGPEWGDPRSHIKIACSGP